MESLNEPGLSCVFAANYFADSTLGIENLGVDAAATAYLLKIALIAQGLQKGSCGVTFRPCTGNRFTTAKTCVNGREGISEATSISR